MSADLNNNNNDVQMENNDDCKSSVGTTSTANSSREASVIAYDSNFNGMDIDFESEEIKCLLLDLESRKPARSGYMLFASSVRSSIGGCGTVSEQSKQISSRWNGLNDKEKNEWNLKVEKSKKEYNEYLNNNPNLKKLLLIQAQLKKKENLLKNGGSSFNSFPLATIKKLILKDPDIQRLSKESLLLISECTSLFIKDLVNKTFDEQMIPNKVKTLSENHLINTFHQNSKYMFIRHVFKKNKNQILGFNANKNKNKQQQASPTKKIKHNANVNNGNTITQFFKQK